MSEINYDQVGHLSETITELQRTVDALSTQFGITSNQLIDLLLSGVDVGQSGQLGELSVLSELSSAKVGDLNTLLTALELRPMRGRGVVGGSGDLMAQGAFGLGGSAAESPNLDLLLDVESGLYRLSNSSTGMNVTSGDTLIRTRFNLNNNTRLLALGRVGSGVSSTPTLRMRSQDNSGNWGSEASFYNNRNILGTVSQSDGVPTGAIIERGSNANGEYVKFAGGLLICTSNISINLTISGFQTFTAPVSFVSDWSASVSFNTGGLSADRLNSASSVVSGYIGSTGSSYRVSVRSSAPSGTPNVSSVVTLIGFWR